MALQEIRDHTSEATFQAYTQACSRVRESHEAGALAPKMTNIQLGSVLVKGKHHAHELGDDLRSVRTRIIEEVLTLRCPRCQAAFLDFEGCLALTCSRCSCNARFCGVCMRECGDETSAHAHIKVCTHNHLGGIHAQGKDLQDMHNKWRTDQLLQVCMLTSASRIKSSRSEFTYDLYHGSACSGCECDAETCAHAHVCTYRRGCCKRC